MAEEAAEGAARAGVDLCVFVLCGFELLGVQLRGMGKGGRRGGEGGVDLRVFVLCGFKFLDVQLREMGGRWERGRGGEREGTGVCGEEQGGCGVGGGRGNTRGGGTGVGVCTSPCSPSFLEATFPPLVSPVTSVHTHLPLLPLLPHPRRLQKLNVIPGSAGKGVCRQGRHNV